jgi:hypothetical protein
MDPSGGREHVLFFKVLLMAGEGENPFCQWKMVTELFLIVRN